MSDLTLAGASLAARCFVGLQLMLPTRALSRLVHSLTRVRWTPFKNGLIHAFMRGFGISLAEAEVERVEDFEHFNAFFTRALKPGERALAPAPAFISPVDGRISQQGPLMDDQLVQAKGTATPSKRCSATPAGHELSRAVTLPRFIWRPTTITASTCRWPDSCVPGATFQDACSASTA